MVLMLRDGEETSSTPHAPMKITRPKTRSSVTPETPSWHEGVARIINH